MSDQNDNLNPKTNADEIVSLIGKCMAETQLAHEGKYDSDKADRTAAMFLFAEMKIAYLIGDVELRARETKNEITRLEAEKYHMIKTGTATKITESSLEQSVARDADVIAAKQDCAKAESESKQWNIFLTILKDGHIFFRNYGKAKNI